MRTAFIQALCEVAEANPRIWLVCGDLGYSVLEPFQQQFPERFVNAGVAEQGMVGIAAGLALCGQTVFVYSIANFPVMRCLEQTRNDVCYHDLDVKIVAVGGGVAYGSAGFTHHAIEDLAVMSAMPNMTVVAPGNPVETTLATHALATSGRPGYLRLGKANEPVVHLVPPDFRIGRSIMVRDGKDVALLSTGGILSEVCRAAELLAKKGISAAVLSLPTLRPFDDETVRAIAARTGHLVTVEEHGRGGLASAVAEAICGKAPNVRFRALRMREQPDFEVHSQDMARARNGLSSGAIVQATLELMSLESP